MIVHNSETCDVPFCDKCLTNIKRVAQQGNESLGKSLTSLPQPEPNKPADELRHKVIAAVCFKPNVSGYLEQFEAIEQLIAQREEAARKQAQREVLERVRSEIEIAKRMAWNDEEGTVMGTLVFGTNIAASLAKIEKELS
jgi:predicted RND superfamily exporter protein